MQRLEYDKKNNNSKPIRGGNLLIQSTSRGKPIEVLIQNPLERENIRESMDTNISFISEINMRTIGVYIREQFIEAKIKQSRNQAIMEYLVQWKNLSVEDPTCEDDSFLQKHPELFKRRGQHFFEGGGHVKTLH